MSKTDTKGVLKTEEDEKDESSPEQPTEMQELTDADLEKVQGGVETDRKAGKDPQESY